MLLKHSYIEVWWILLLEQPKLTPSQIFGNGLFPLSTSFRTLSTFSVPSLKKIYVVFGAAVSTDSLGVNKKKKTYCNCADKRENRCSISVDLVWKLSHLSLSASLWPGTHCGCIPATARFSSRSEASWRDHPQAWAAASTTCQTQTRFLLPPSSHDFAWKWCTYYITH